MLSGFELYPRWVPLTFWFVMGRKCFCPCDIVNSLYFLLKEIAVTDTLVKIVNKFIGTKCEGLVGRTNAA